MPEILHPHTDFEQVMCRHTQGFQVILVKVDGQVHAYRNSCPHVGVGLDWGDGTCLSAAGELICSMHGALFDARSGLCTHGPCAGDHLERVPIRIADGMVVCMIGVDA